MKAHLHKILAIDTATEACSTALYVDGEIVEDFRVAPRQHTTILLPMIEQLMESTGVKLADLDAIAFGQGPGSFTGLRIAASIAQGIAFSAELPIVPVSTLAAVAQGVARQYQSTDVLVALDARMKEVYWGIYRMGMAGLVELVGDEKVCSPATVSLPVDVEEIAWSAAGDGWKAYEEELVRCDPFVKERFPEQYPHAFDVAVLAADQYARGNTIQAEKAQPVYLRNNVAKKQVQPKK